MGIGEGDVRAGSRCGPFHGMLSSVDGESERGMKPKITSMRFA